jgi:hypothetical protein
MTVATGPSPALPGNTIEAPRPLKRNGRRGQRRWWDRKTVAMFAGVAGSYLILSVILWWNVWSSDPSNVTTCGCGDTSLILWFIEWPAFALSHGQNLFYSTALFHPQGINMVANTSSLAIGVALAPITWLFGPVASLNVASTLGPAASALAMFWLLRRWVVWAPAAFAGGLVFGFSPFVVVNLAGGHLMTGFLVLIPLIAACLDELLMRRRRSPVKVGLALGLLLTVQFFVGTEILTITVLASVVATLLVAGYALVCRRSGLGARARHTARGLAVAAGASLVLLAYPLWFLVKGNAHFDGLVWPTIAPGRGGLTVGHLYSLGYQTGLQRQMLRTGGYQGPALPYAEYLGFGLLFVLAVGLVVWRRDLRLWFFAALAVVCVIFGIGTTSYWTPWRLFTDIPLVQNVIPSRFSAVLSLFVGAMLAIVIDQTHSWVAVALERRYVADVGEPRRPAPKARWIGAAAGAAALAVAAVGVWSMASGVVSNVPIAAQTVTVPRWFTQVAPNLPPGQVVLTYPAPFTLFQSPEDWQAVEGMHFALVGGSGPESVLQRAGKEKAGQIVIADAAFSLTGPPHPTDAHVGAVRRALAGWGVTTIVMPDPTVLPPYEVALNPGAALGLFTVATGRAPTFEAGAWVWHDVHLLDDPRTVSPQAFTACVSVGVRPTRDALARVPACVISASRPRT